MEPVLYVSRVKTGEADTGKRDYRHRSRTGCGAGEVDGFWLDLLAYSDSSRWGWQERLGRYIWGDRASWLSWYHHEREFMKVKHVSQDLVANLSNALHDSPLGVSRLL
jgi:hypothetical protein